MASSDSNGASRGRSPKKERPAKSTKADDKRNSKASQVKPPKEATKRPKEAAKDRRTPHSSSDDMQSQAGQVKQTKSITTRPREVAKTNRALNSSSEESQPNRPHKKCPKKEARLSEDSVEEIEKAFPVQESAEAKATRRRIQTLVDDYQDSRGQKQEADFKLRELEMQRLL